MRSKSASAVPATKNFINDATAGKNGANGRSAVAARKPPSSPRTVASPDEKRSRSATSTAQLRENPLRRRQDETSKKRVTLVAERVMFQADQFGQNGNLCIVALQQFLRQTEHDGFMQWLTERRIFTTFDAGASGHIDMVELKDAMKAYYNNEFPDHLASLLSTSGQTFCLSRLHELFDGLKEDKPQTSVGPNGIPMLATTTPIDMPPVVEKPFKPAEFCNLAEFYKDAGYANLMKDMMEKARPGSPLRPRRDTPITNGPSEARNAPANIEQRKVSKEVPRRSKADSVPNLLFQRFCDALEKHCQKANEAIDENWLEAASNAKSFVKEHRDSIIKAWSRFSADGRLADGKPLPASANNDFYKWTMLPVLRAVDRSKPKGVTCTFSVNIRDVTYRTALYESATKKRGPELFDALTRELKQFAARPFDRHVFERLVTDFKLPGWDESALEAVCGYFWSPRTLADEVVVDTTEGTPLMPTYRNNVLIHVFVAHDMKLGEDRVYIEATGPWPRVTWLETSMMAAVYDCLFRDSMRKRYESQDDNLWYPEWLAEAFLRCARSEIAASHSGLRGALFSGRRTGGLPLLMLQAMYLQHTFCDANGVPKLLGQSSVTAHYWLKDGGVPAALIPRPVGTHAHELSMVLSGVFCDVDEKAGLPLTQAIGHALYFYLSIPQGDVRQSPRKALMPMLPDTLGTRAFMRTTSLLRVPRGPHKGEAFLNVIGAARQDSGDLEAFRDIMREYGFTGALMASEIEGAEDLFIAKDCGYALFGAGGFFGDSMKAWDPSSRNISLACKVLRVYVSDVKTWASPVKTGDPPASRGPVQLEGKLEGDGLLSKEEWSKLKERTAWLAGDDNKRLNKQDLQDLFASTLESVLGPDE